jgi:hypothetical protein
MYFITPYEKDSSVCIVDTNFKKKEVCGAIRVKYMCNLSAIVSIVVNNQKPNMYLDVHMFKCHLAEL